jgi:hypothetical protein
MEETIEGVEAPIQTNMQYDPALLPEETDQKQFFIDAVLRLREIHEQKVEEERGIEEAARKNREKFNQQ